MRQRRADTQTDRQTDRVEREAGTGSDREGRTETERGGQKQRGADRNREGRTESEGGKHTCPTV